MDDLINLLAIRNLENAELRNGVVNTRHPENPFIQLNERQFINMFRISKDLCHYLINGLEPYLNPQKRATDLDLRSKVLAALRFFAGGAYQNDVASNKYINMSQASVSRSLNEVVEALNNPTILNEWVAFPNNLEKLNTVRQVFFQQHGFPGVVGCIDCTHVAIFPPNINDPDYPEHLYINRKNYHSINVQLICDADCKIMNVCARYPGSTNDAYIWGRSNIQTLLRNLHAAGHKDYFLLGDSGYPLRTWLLTPFNEVEPNTIESHYNDCHKSTRVKIECCNGLLKARFRCLLKHRVLHYSPITACKIINACVILHNMCIEFNVPVPEDDDNVVLDYGMVHENPHIEEDEDIARRINPELADGRRARRNVARSLRRNNN